MIQQIQKSTSPRAEVVTHVQSGRPEIILASATCKSEATSFGFLCSAPLRFNFHLNALPVVCMSLCSATKLKAGSSERVCLSRPGGQGGDFFFFSLTLILPSRSLNKTVCTASTKNCSCKVMLHQQLHVNLIFSASATMCRFRHMQLCCFAGTSVKKLWGVFLFCFFNFSPIL